MVAVGSQVVVGSQAVVGSLVEVDSLAALGILEVVGILVYSQPCLTCLKYDRLKFLPNFYRIFDCP